jgi:hypothetical protein
MISSGRPATPNHKCIEAGQRMQNLCAEEAAARLKKVAFDQEQKGGQKPPLTLDPYSLLDVRYECSPVGE